MRLAVCGKYELHQWGPELRFVYNRAKIEPRALFLGLILGSNVAAILVGAFTAKVFGVGVGLGAAFLAFFSVCYATWRLSRLDPPPDLLLIAILNLETQTLHGGDGMPLAPLASVSVGSEMQLTSSSSLLRIRHPGGKLVVAVGVPLFAPIGPMLNAVRQF